MSESNDEFQSCEVGKPISYHFKPSCNCPVESYSKITDGIYTLYFTVLHRGWCRRLRWLKQLIGRKIT